MMSDSQWLTFDNPMLFLAHNSGVNGTRSRAPENVELFQLMARKIHDGALVATILASTVLALALPRLRGGVGSIDLIRYRRACWKDKLASHQSGTRTGTWCA
jgi:hypothetical protein